MKATALRQKLMILENELIGKIGRRQYQYACEYTADRHALDAESASMLAEIMKLEKKIIASEPRCSKAAAICHSACVGQYIEDDDD